MLVPQYDYSNRATLVPELYGGNFLKKIAQAFTNIGKKVVGLFGGRRRTRNLQRIKRRHLGSQLRRRRYRLKGKQRNQKGGFVGTLAASILAP